MILKKPSGLQIASSKFKGHSLTKDQLKTLATFFESFPKASECFKYIDTTKKGYILGADWTHAVQQRLALASHGKVKIKTFDAY